MVSEKLKQALEAMDEATLRRRLEQAEAVFTDVEMRDAARHHIGSRGRVKGIVSGARLDNAAAQIREAIVAELERRGLKP